MTWHLQESNPTLLRLPGYQCLPRCLGAQHRWEMVDFRGRVRNKRNKVWVYSGLLPLESLIIILSLAFPHHSRDNG